MKNNTEIIQDDASCPLWTWDKELSHEICQKLINLGEGKWTKAEVKGNDSPEKEGMRKSDIVWITDQWVYDLIWEYMLGANESAGWNYNILAAESCQITRYTKDGYYSWHRDGMGSHKEVFNMPDNKFLHNNTRKLSMSIVLNSDFEGGDFEISGAQRYLKEGTPKLEEGSIIVFPSFLEHRVAPVTKGTRYSLVTWFMGPPYV